MARGDNGQITKDYLDKKPLDKKLVTKVGRNNGGWSGSGPMYASPGTMRYWYDENQLYSYDMPLVTRVVFAGKDFYVLNGDGAPSMKTNEHQGTLRRVLQNHVPREQWAIVPYSALERADVEPHEVEIVATTPDRHEEVWSPCRAEKCTGRKWHHEWDGGGKTRGTDEKHEVSRRLHYLGETLFRVKRRGDDEHVYFVCGLDRNDDPRRRMFYLAQLPRTGRKPPKTVDEALDALRPVGLSPETPRQGEWFFVPFGAKADKLDEKAWRKLLRIKADVPVEVEVEKTVFRKRTEEEKKADAEYAALPRWKKSGGNRAWVLEQRRRENHYASVDERPDERRHYAPVIVHVRAGDRHEMYVRGTIRDAEHDPLRLPDGWHHVVKNRAVQGWRAGGGSQNRGARVD